jgi:hypothetical protein
MNGWVETLKMVEVSIYMSLSYNRYISFDTSSIMEVSIVDFDDDFDIFDHPALLENSTHIIKC